MKHLDKITALFDYIVYYMWTEGGDGWALVVSNDYRELANLFHEYDKNNDNRFAYSGESENLISFSRNDSFPENISFTNIMPNEFDRRFYELVIKVDNILLGYKKEIPL